MRAFNPFPVASTSVQGEKIKVWSAHADPAWSTAGAPPGSVLGAGEAGIDVATGQGVLRICALQRAGGKRLDAAEFLRGFALQPGMQFDPAPGA